MKLTPIQERTLESKVEELCAAVKNTTGGWVTVSPEAVELLKQIFIQTIEKEQKPSGRP